MIERIRRALGISCVEIYLLALFERHNVDRNEVFTESYIPLHRLISDFTENVQTNFASYAGLERVQSIAARKKMAEFSNLPCKKNTAFQYYMYRVKPEYKNAGLRPWRDDHFLLGYEGEFYDCYPPSKVLIKDIDALSDFKIGVRISSDFKGDPSEQYRKLKESIAGVPYRETDVGGIGNDLRRLRDALLIFKISRQRINCILQSKSLNDLIYETGKITGIIEASRLRHQKTDFKIAVGKLCILEKQWIEELMSKEKNEKV